MNQRTRKNYWKFEMIIRIFKNSVKDLNSGMEIVEDPIRDMIFKVKTSPRKLDKKRHG